MASFSRPGSLGRCSERRGGAKAQPVHVRVNEILSNLWHAVVVAGSVLPLLQPNSQVTFWRGCPFAVPEGRLADL